MLSKVKIMKKTYLLLSWEHDQKINGAFFCHATAELA